MLYLLVDTCIWLDLARNVNGEQLIAAVRVLVHQKQVELLVPGIVVEEFERNRERVQSAMTRSIAADFRQVRAIIDIHGRARGRKAALNLIDDLTHRVPLINQMATRHFDEILELLSAGTTLDITPRARERAVHRALEKRAPFHHDKNSIADALLIELYAEWVHEQFGNSNTFAFVTGNTRDFSEPQGDLRDPHPDLAAVFGDDSHSHYFTSLGTALLSLLKDHGEELLDELDFMEEPRRLDEIRPLLDKLLDQVWYNRHKNLEYRIEMGEVTFVDEWDRERHAVTIVRDVWDGAKASARRVEEKWGIEELGPWDDFEWGMINGKLSALRWVLGEDWESSLDT